MENERINEEKEDSFLVDTIRKAESEMGQGLLRFSNQKVVYYNPETKSFVLFGYVGPKITYVYGTGEIMEEHMTWPDRYAISFEGVEETESELKIKFSGQYEGYGGFMYDADDLVLNKKEE